MNIKSLLGFQTKSEKIQEYRELLEKRFQVEKETDQLAEVFALQKSQYDDFSNEVGETKDKAVERFQSFLKQHSKDVSTLYKKKTSIEKSIGKMEKDEELSGILKDIKILNGFRSLWKNGQIKKSIYFELMKAKQGKVRFSDILVMNPKGELLILQRADEGGSYSPNWCIPGGHVDPGENFKEAACRELFEETGIKCNESKLSEVGIYDDHKIEIHYFMYLLDENEFKLNDVVVDAFEEIGSTWINPIEEIDEYQFIYDMKENIKRILGIPYEDRFVTILNHVGNKEVSVNILKAFCEKYPDEVRKSKNKNYFSHKERKDLAEKGEAMPNGKYPIRNLQDLKDAIRLVGSSDMPKSEVKVWIEKRAKELGLTEHLPESWKEIEKSHFSEEERKELAEEGEAMPDGKFPIRNASDLRNAIRLSGSSDLPKSEVIAWIKKRAKELGLENELPESWNEEVEKTMDCENTEALREESLDGEEKKVIEKSSENSFSLHIRFNDLEEAEMLKGIIEDLNNEGKLNIQSIEEVLEKSIDEEKQVFTSYLNFIEGAKTRLKNIHWSEEDNSKHVYLDDLSEEVGEFEDKIAEAGQSGFGRFEDDEIQGDEIEESDPIKICQMIFDKTIEFRKKLEGKDYFNGEISWIDDFLASLKQSKYRLQMH